MSAMPRLMPIFSRFLPTFFLLIGRCVGGGGGGVVVAELLESLRAAAPDMLRHTRDAALMPAP